MYRTSAQIDTLGTLLAAFFPSLCTQLDLPETSVQGRTVHALRLRGGGVRSGAAFCSSAVPTLAS